MTWVSIANSSNSLSPRCLRGLFSNCVARPTAAPITDIFSDFCGGMHRMSAQRVPGQTYTQFQTKPSRHLSWSNVSDIYGFPGITAEVASGFCSGDAGGDFWARARGCNECGCGPWGPEANFSYFPYECR